jgi:hypothetical protein
MSEQAVGFLRARLTGVANERYQERIDAECAALQSQRSLIPAVGATTSSPGQSDQLQQGNRFPECAPMKRVIAQIDEAIERDLEACRETLRRFNAR